MGMGGIEIVPRVINLHEEIKVTVHIYVIACVWYIFYSSINLLMSIGVCSLCHIGRKLQPLWWSANLLPF
jgi:hypothetical protein